MNQKFTKKQDFVVKQCKKGFKIIKTFTIDLPVLKQEVKITPDKVLETRINHQFGYSFSLLNLDSDPDPEGFPRQDRDAEGRRARDPGSRRAAGAFSQHQ